jgi:hypothetical protein
LVSLYEAWRRWGEKPKILEEYEVLPPHFSPVITAYNFLKQLRDHSETGLKPLSLKDVHLYICEVLRYSDDEYSRWMIEMVVACDIAERQAFRESMTKG